MRRKCERSALCHPSGRPAPCTGPNDTHVGEDWKPHQCLEVSQMVAIYYKCQIYDMNNIYISLSCIAHLPGVLACTSWFSNFPLFDLFVEVLGSSSFSWLLPGGPVTSSVASLLLVAMPFAPSSEHCS